MNPPLLRPTSWLLVLTMLLSGLLPSASAQTPANAGTSLKTSSEAAPLRVTVRLDQDRMLHGVVPVESMSPQGQFVVLGQEGRVIKRVRCRQNGAFVIGPLKPGDYEIASNEAAAFLRVVPLEHAGEPQIEVSPQAMVSRGQDPHGTLLHASLIALVVAAAITLPFVLDQDDDAS